ncbi:MAG: hypothetical protein ACPGYY_06175 [Bacteroidia bacterium]
MKGIKITLTILFTITIANINAGASLFGTVDFYGHSTPYTFGQALLNLRLHSLTQSEISENLVQYRNANLSKSTSAISRQVDLYNLDDAGTVLLVNKIAQNLAKSTKGNRVHFIKYLLLKELGYDVILTRTGRDLNCLGNLAFTPGRYIYINYAGKTYKDVDFAKRTSSGQHLIYRDSHKTSKRIKRNIYNVPRVNANKRNKEINFSFGVEKHNLKAISNASLTEFLADLPMFEVGREFTQLRVSRETDTSVIQYLKDQVADRETVDAVRFLLAFVQQVSPYGSDFEKYGEERFYYPEETIMSTSADCEDKAILLAFLTKKILNIESKGLFFENDEHLSLAIQIPEYKHSASFIYQGETYVSCEPTAQYPRLGHSQFNLKRVTKIIDL